MAVTTDTAAASVNLERMYTGALRENFTQHELELIASDEALQRKLEMVRQSVWRPTPEELLRYVLRQETESLRGTTRKQIKYHLEVDKAKEANDWVEDYALLELHNLIMTEK